MEKKLKVLSKVQPPEEMRFSLLNQLFMSPVPLKCSFAAISPLRSIIASIISFADFSFSAMSALRYILPVLTALAVKGLKYYTSQGYKQIEEKKKGKERNKERHLFYWTTNKYLL